MASNTNKSQNVSLTTVGSGIEIEDRPISEQAFEVCHKLLGSKPDCIDTPGGKSRESVRAWFGDQSIIVTRRKELNRARLEAAVLRSLNQAGVLVPRLAAAKGNWLLQQDMGSQRLSQVLACESEPKRLAYLHRGIDTLLKAQIAGTDLKFPEQLVTLGENKAWSRKLIDRRLHIDRYLKTTAPELPIDELHDLLRVRQPRFLKWDARSGNAIVTPGGNVGWIDWEHCGCRNGPDDLVWLLADEYTCCSEDSERELLQHWLPAFAEGWPEAEAWDYFYTYGVLHSLVRLCYVLRYKGDGQWWDPQRCLDQDRVGVTREHALLLATRARRWAAETEMLLELVPWLDEVVRAIPD